MRSNRRRFLRGVGLAAIGAAAVATKPSFGQGTTARAKPRGIAMTVGLNRLDPDHYPGAPHYGGASTTPWPSSRSPGSRSSRATNLCSMRKPPPRPCSKEFGTPPGS